MKVLFLSILATAGVLANESGPTISGSIVDASSGEPAVFANVVVLAVTDSSVVTGATTDIHGAFAVHGVRPGRYILEVRLIGFKTGRTSFSYDGRNVDLGRISITPSTVTMKDVIVQGSRTPVSYRGDRKVIDVTRMQTSVSGNAADVLENVPSVSVDVDGNVSLRGSTNFTVLVDGRPASLDAQEVLQQIPASAIKTIEIITNPSAKYNPEGSAGIINIILEEERDLGLSGIGNATAGMYNSYGGNLVLEYKMSGIKTHAGFDYNRRFHPGNSVEVTTFGPSSNSLTTNASGDRERGRISGGVRAGITVSLSAFDELSAGGEYGNRDSRSTSLLRSTQWSLADPTIVSFTHENNRRRSGNQFSLNGGYSRRFTGEGHELHAELYYRHNSSDEWTITAERSGDSTISGKWTTETGPSSSFRGKMDYALPMGGDKMFEAGYQFETHNSVDDTGLKEFDPAALVYSLRPEFDNAVEYVRTEHAGYGILKGQLGMLLIQGGVRGEYTFRTISTGSSEYRIDRWDLFPSAHLSYAISDLSQITTSYSRRIERPRGWQLEPFDTWLDANSVRRGNPALQPEFVDSYELGVQTSVGQTLVSSEAYYRVTHNKIERLTSVYAEDVTLTSPFNVGTDYSLGVETQIVADPVAPWEVNLMGNLYHYRISGVLDDEPFSRSSVNWRLRMNNTIMLSEWMQLQINSTYSSPFVSSQGRREANFTTDLALRRDFFSKALSVTIQVHDVFDTRTYEFTEHGIDYSRYGRFSRKAPLVQLNLRFNLNANPSETPRDDSDASQDPGGEF